MAPRVSRSWSWTFAGTPDEVWPVLSDTARFNEAFGTARYVLEEVARPDGSVLRLGRARLGPLRLTWEEPPFDWVAGRWFSQTRHFHSGPLRSAATTLRLAPLPGGRTAASYSVTLEGRGLAGAVLLRLGALPLVGRRIGRLMRHADAYLKAAVPTPFPHPAPALGRTQRLRAQAAAASLLRAGHPPDLVRRLVQRILTAGEAEILRIRPRALAAEWQAPERSVIGLCLAATRAGLLDMVWAVLCPRCRGAKAAVATLDALPADVHCPSCNIDYGRDFARNVEVSFRPSAQIRPLAAGEYCLSGPMATRHVLVQIAVAPGETRTVDASLPAGPLRLRTVEPGGAADIEHDGAALPAILAEGEAVRAGGLQPPGTLLLHNATGRRRTFVIESRAWRADALTAHQLTTLQVFRDLFREQTLRPGDDVAIRHVTLMFTDLKGSTAFYERIGDGPAYRLVRDHFAFLARVVREHDGAVVKTIGDAVMAAFADPGAAVAAGLAIQGRVAAFNAASGAADIVIKLGLHGGPCIAVTLNDRLDYFGSTVNLAARLQGQSAGGDLVISEALAQDPGVATLLGRIGSEAACVPLKGFARPVAYRRIAGAALAATPPEIVDRADPLPV